MDLGALLTTQFLSVALVFARIGAAMMFMPGFGESFITPRHRLATSLLIALVITPLVAQGPVPTGGVDLVLAFGIEVTLGIWIGLVSRVLLTAMQVAGAQIGMVSGLSNAFAPDIGSFQGSTLIATSLLLGAIAVIFAADIHHVIIDALIESYFTFPPGTMMPGDLAEQMIRAGQNAFYIGVSVAAPFFVMGVVLNVGLGLTNRMLPSLPVFFVAAPVLIAAGLFVLVLAVPTAIRTFISHFVEWLGMMSF
ncbi:flagellar biosynthetic protein FliR [Pseudooceanicola sp. MF1-13]|uniref:flagellar biosynthetic protein FliR n=1 Tax=Pseudooceanicola sp. MF1-13 TaxID=3379095 RepID=UPI003892BD71